MSLILRDSSKDGSSSALGPSQGPQNPFQKREQKNVPTGFAQEEVISEHAFRRGQLGPVKRPHKSETEAIRSKRQRRRDPWARYDDSPVEEEDEYEEIWVDADEEEEEEQEQGTEAALTKAPMPKASTAYSNAVSADKEQTEFHGESERDYQGRTYMHVPRDLDIDLTKEVGSSRNFIPKKQIHTWKSHTKAITSLNFFPNSGHLLLSSSADGQVKLWDCYHSRSLLRSFRGHNKSVADATFSPNDGRTFLSGAYDRTIKLWDTETGQCSARFSPPGVPHVIRFNASSSPHEFIAGLSNKQIVQYDTRSGELTQTYDHHLGAVNTLTFVDDDKRFISTSDDKSLRAWEFGIPVPIKIVAEPHMFSMSRAALHPSGKYVALQSGDNQIVVFGATDRFRQNRKKSYRGHNNAGHGIDLDVSPDGQFLMSGDSGGYACVWDWKTCKMYDKWIASDGPVVCAKWHPQESSKVATAGLDGVIKYWD